MQTTSLIKFTGTLTALTGLSYTVPDAETRGKIALMPRFGNGVYINAPAIRSALRHAATDVITELAGTKPRLPDYFLSALGGIMNAKGGDASEDGADGEESADDAKNSDAASVSAIRRAAYARRHNPVVNLFGSMPHGIPGRLYVSHGIPSDKNVTTIVRHVRANDFQRDPSLADRLDDSAVREFIARQDVAGERSRIKAERDSLKAKNKKTKDQAEKALLDERIEALDKELKEKVLVQVSLPQLGYEMVTPGATFTTEFVLDGASDLEISLFLLALDRFAAMPMLGGKRNHGLGRVKAEWAVTGRPSTERSALRDMGAVIIDGEFGPLRVDGEMARYFSDSALREALANGQLNFTEAGLISAALPSAS